MRTEANILLVEDELDVMQLHCRILGDCGYNLIRAATVEEARTEFRRSFIDLLILDDRLNSTDGKGGRDLLREFRTKDADIAAIFVSAHSDSKTLLEVIQLGACDYVVKGGGDFSIRFRFAVQHALNLNVQQRQWRWLKSRLTSQSDDSALVGQSDSMSKVREVVRRVAQHDQSDVLIVGETGTGKEVVANEIHRLSPRNDKLFVDCNASSLPATLIEAELFGTVDGAYTGAVNRAGLFEAANDGTLFLDEIGDLPRESQPKLLRVLETRTFTRLGSTKRQHTSARVVAATNAELKSAIKSGLFREDLYQRFAIRIQLPPLRERKEDIELLATKLVQSLASKYHRSCPFLGNEVLQKLRSYQWPGNVRELRNTLERAMVMSNEDHIDPATIEFENRDDRKIHDLSELGNLPYEPALHAFEKYYWTELLKRTGGNRSESARLAGIHRSRMYEHFKTYGIREIEPDETEK